MPASTARAIAPDEAISINEVAVATAVSARQINRLIDDAVLPKSVCVKLGSRRALRAFAVPMVSFGAADGTKLSKAVRLEVMRLIAAFTKEHWRRLCTEPEHAERLRFESGSLVIALGLSVSTAMAGLNKLSDARHRIALDPEVRGGLAVVRGTRIGVHEIADSLAADGMDLTLEDFPALSPEDIEVAALYAKAHPRPGRPRGGSSSRRLVAEVTVGSTDAT